MGRFKKTRRRKRNPVKWPYQATLIVALAGALLGSLFVWQSYRKTQTPLASSNAANSLRSQSSLERLPRSHNASTVAARPLFPYSVIPGGIESAQELENAIAHDPVVSEHYKGFNLAKLRIIRLDRDRMAYVSYRLGDRVYWTKRKLKLFVGETLVTDGEHQARTRCGNRLSSTPSEPVSPHQPAVEAMEAQPTPELVAMNDVLLDVSPAPLFGPALPGGSPTGVVIPPAVFPIVGGSGSPVPNGPPSPPLGSPDPPPIATPEPGVAPLLVAGLSIVWLVSIRKRRKRRKA